MVRDGNKLAWLNEDQVRHLANRYGTPVFVYNLGAMARSVEDLSRQVNKAINGPTIRHSIKANPLMSVLATFDKAGCLFDASSIWEAKRAIQAGISPRKILVTAQELTEGWQNIVALGVEIDAGSLKQLDDYGQAFPNTSVSIRLNPGFGSGMVQRLTSGGSQSSFGIWHEYIHEVIRISKKHQLSITRLHSHIGSGHDSKVWEQAQQFLCNLLDLFPEVVTVNMGGGYRIPTFANEPPFNHEKVIGDACEFLHRISNFFGRKLNLEVEPGTYLTGNHGSLICHCIDTGATGSDGIEYLKLNAGLTEIARTSLYATPHPVVGVPRIEPEKRNQVREMAVFGHCCIAGDLITQSPGEFSAIGKQWIYPCSAGDLIVVERAGGYCDSMSLKHFNSYPAASVIATQGNNEFFVIRDRESLSDVTRHELPLPSGCNS